MKCVVVGAGAMGCAYGALLSEGGHDVTLIDGWQDHVAAIQQSGLTIDDAHGRTRRVNIKANTTTAGIGPADLVFAFCKSHQTAEAAKVVLSLSGPETTVITLQNGLGNAEVLAEAVGSAHVVLGVSFHGAAIRGPGHIFHGGTGESIIGDLDLGDRASTRKIAEAFTAVGIPTRAEADIRPVFWGKLLVNVGVNAVSALTGMTCGELVAHDAVWQLVASLVKETQAVFEAEGFHLPFDPLSRIEQAMRNLPSSKASMAQDIENGRPTEVNVLNGAIARLAARHGIPAPVNQAVTALISGLEATRGQGHA